VTKIRGSIGPKAITPTKSSNSNSEIKKRRKEEEKEMGGKSKGTKKKGESWTNGKKKIRKNIFVEKNKAPKNTMGGGLRGG